MMRALVVGALAPLALASFQVANPRATAKCNAGFHLVGSSCVENTCHCDFGFASSSTKNGQICGVDNGYECHSCLPGHHLLANKSCSKNVCSCEHGEPDANLHEICEVDNANECRACDSGYHLQNEFCLENMCQCENGEVDTMCDVHDANECASCRTGYSLFNENCSENTCTCRNGISKQPSVNSQTCRYQGSNECASCNAGFHLEGSECLENVCTCPQGIADSTSQGSTICDKHGSTECSSCLPGYHLENEKCVNSECICSEEGENLSWHSDLNVCSKEVCDQRSSRQKRQTETCDEFFELVGGVCENTNSCYCDNGMADHFVNNGNICNVDGAQECNMCNSGYELLDAACVQIDFVIENPSEILHIEFINKGDFDRSIDEFSETYPVLEQHGCHCVRLNTSMLHPRGGTPLDDMDALCRRLISCRSCLAKDHSEGDHSLCSEQTVYHISYADATRQSYECTDVEFGCRRMMCESDKIMVAAFMLYMDDHPGWAATTVTEEECYREEELGVHSLGANIIARLNNNIHIEADTCCLSTLQTYVLGLSHCEAGYFYQ